MPAGTPKYFSYPFGVSGDLTTVPDPTQAGGSVSYNQGFGPDYALINTDPSYLSIPRNQFNQLLFDVTSTLQQIYQNGFPLFITSAMNGGSAYSYSKNAYVYQVADGNVYYSLVNSNTDVPPSVKWQVVGGSTATSYFNAATDTGTANHYVIAPVPSVVPAAGDVVILQPVHANTGACDININSAGAIAIKTLANQDPAASMLIPSGTYFLAYNAVTGFWVIMNPSPVSVNSNVGSFTNTNLTVNALGLVTAASNGGLTLVGPTAFNSATAYTAAGLPAGIKQLSILLNNVTTSSQSNLLFQLGVSGGIVNTGYTGEGINSLNASTSASSTAGIPVYCSAGLTPFSGRVNFDLVDATNNIWVCSYVLANGSEGCNFGGGSVALSGALTQFKFTTVGGTATWNAGKISYSYW